MSTQIKICCIKSAAEAFMVISAGVDAIGLVSQMPSGPGMISEQTIKSIVDIAGSEINTFLLSSLTKATDIIDQHERLQTKTIQLVDDVAIDEIHKVKATLPHVRIVQVIHVLDESSVLRAIEVAPHVDGLLLDSGNPNLDIKILGGTGNTHDWALSKEIVKEVSKPVFLAGGLNPENIQEAIEVVRPFGVDICSGVRTDGKLNEEKLVNFVASVKG